MTDTSSFPSDLSSDEMAEYLRLYLDETTEHLDALVETLLGLEAEPTSTAGLNEAFRLIHSIKGSSALLGLDRITSLTHHLETHFERLRSGRRLLDTATMNVVLRCIDFLRESNQSLRHGQAIASAVELLEQVKGLEATAGSAASAPVHAHAPVPANAPPAHAAAPQPLAAQPSAWRLGVRFCEGLPMAEMKAELILTRLSSLGTIADCQPPRDDIAGHAGLRGIEIIVSSAADRTSIEETARVAGVDAITLEPVDADATARPLEPAAVDAKTSGDEPAAAAARGSDTCLSAVSTPEARDQAASQPAGTTASLGETVRVDVDRLDVLLNLTGELVINRARLTQLAGEMAPTFKKSGVSGRTQAAAGAIRELLRDLADRSTGAGSERLVIEEQLDALESQARLWDESRHAFGELSAAIDQLTRVSDSLQRGVLNTRMVPVGPLFNRFKRSVRDIAQELGKRVKLEIVGEKTELDKRMIDEIGDPLNHLIRNCIDHGIESADTRIARGKPDTATLRLSAAHRGNNVFITVEDDGGGIDTQRVRQIARERGLISAETAESLSESEAIDLIFEPGFSTAARVSGISGRGFGMDIVRTRIAALNGTIEVDSERGRGTRFTIRLPLTLTITRCMLFRLPQGVLAVPIEHVREITRTAAHRSVVVDGRRWCDIRGELLPLVGIDELFTWHDIRPEASPAPHVAVLHAGNRSLGLRVDELLGGQDLVVKPLDENFIHIRGLGGASILGDGMVCLLLDVAACLELVRRGAEASSKAAIPMAP
ncbi:MAG: ATP-binding protein [Planctomycetia bacterium]